MRDHRFKEWPKNRQFILLVTIILIIFCVLGIFTLGKQREKFVPSNTPAVIANSTENWKTYTDPTNGFLIKYPSNWIFTSNSQGQDMALGFGVGNQPATTYLTISTKKSINISSLQKCHGTGPMKFPCLSNEVTSIQLGSKTALLADVMYGIADSDYQIVQTTDTPSIELKMNVSGGGLSNMFSQILSTFLFVTPTSQNNTSNWKTYVGANNQFSFQYPSNWLIDDTKQPPELNFSFVENKKTYVMSLFRGGRGGPSDTFSDKSVTLDGKQFLERTWSKNKQAFFIAAMPDLINFDPGFADIEINLPPTNTTKYINIFDQVLSTFKFSNLLNYVIPADSQSPAAGVCSSVSGSTVTIVLNSDSPNPRCVKVVAGQFLRLDNNTNQLITFVLGKTYLSISPDSSTSMNQNFGSFFAPGVHDLVVTYASSGQTIPSPEIWLQ